MKEELLNPVKSAPDERYCDWIFIGDSGQSVRCTNKPEFRNAVHINWKLCAKCRGLAVAWNIWESIGQ